MKRVLFGLLVITAAISFACSPQPAINKTDAIGNRALAAGGTTYSVGINLALKSGSTDTYHFEVAPEDTLLKADTDQAQWVVTNFTDLALSDVVIDHFKGQKTGNTDPFKNGGKFTYPVVNAHSTEGSLKSGTSAIVDTFDYQVSATLTLKDGKKVPVTLDPRIVVSSGLVR